MKTFIVLLALCTVALGAEYESCYKQVDRFCQNNKHTPMLPVNCTATYGNFPSIESSLQRYVNEHFIKSFQYLLMSTNFANYNRNRPGFEKLFRGLSDDTWGDAIELIQYISKRGGTMNFEMMNGNLENTKASDVDLYEFYSIAKALDTHKELASDAIKVHKVAQQHRNGLSDPEVSSYLEKEFMHKHRDIIRKLAGYATDLTRLLEGTDSSLSLFMFDEYLQKL